MTLSIKHPLTAISPENPAYEINPSNWNASHTMLVAANSIVGNNTGSTAEATALTTSEARVLLGLPAAGILTSVTANSWAVIATNYSQRMSLSGYAYVNLFLAPQFPQVQIRYTLGNASVTADASTSTLMNSSDAQNWLAAGTATHVAFIRELAMTADVTTNVAIGN